MKAWNKRNKKIIMKAGASLKPVASTLFSRKRYFKNCIITKDVSISCQFELPGNMSFNLMRWNERHPDKRKEYSLSSKKRFPLRRTCIFHIQSQHKNSLIGIISLKGFWIFVWQCILLSYVAAIVDHFDRDVQMR